LTLTLIIAKRKLKSYFEAHLIRILADHPLTKMIHKYDNLGRMLLWAVELSRLDIEYRPKAAIKAQVLWDLLKSIKLWIIG